jgi:hypothetical protein
MLRVRMLPASDKANHRFAEVGEKSVGTPRFVHCGYIIPGKIYIR